MDQFKEQLDQILFSRTQLIENKRMMYVKRQLEIEKMEENSLKKRLLYAEEVKIGKDANQEERELHEAYQFCIREYEVRHRERPGIESGDSPTLGRKGSRKKDKKRSSEVISMYRGPKTVYEKTAEAMSAEEVWKEIEKDKNKMANIY